MNWDIVSDPREIGEMHSKGTAVRHSMKNRGHSLLDYNGITLSMGDLKHLPKGYFHISDGRCYTIFGSIPNLDLWKRMMMVKRRAYVALHVNI